MRLQFSREKEMLGGFCRCVCTLETVVFVIGDMQQQGRDVLPSDSSLNLYAFRGGLAEPLGAALSPRILHAQL